MAKPIYMLPVFLAFLALATLCVLPISISQPSPSYHAFVFNATEMPSEDYYDYIIVGGGTAGCPLAATLSEKFRVLLLERGGVPYGRPNLMTQDGFLSALTDVDSHDSPAQAFISEDGVPNARGRVLGGSSAINARFYSRTDPDFFTNSGIDWDLRVVNQSFEWVENNEKAIVFRPELKNWQTAVRDGRLEAGISPYNGFALDHLLGTKIGGSTFDSSGRRHSATDLLSYATAANIKVVVHASVYRILIASSSLYPASRKSATGVVYRDLRGGFHHAMLSDKGEVLLSTGALGSPQLLLLSGVGPRPYLSSWGIPVVQHNLYVGQFLYDNLRNGISIMPSVPLEHSLIQVVGITNSGAYLQAAFTVIPFASPARGVFITPSPSTVYFTVATLMEKIVGPLSAGSLRLASTDVRVNPIVLFNYFSNHVDLQKCVNGTRMVAAVLRSRAMDDFKFRQWFGGGDFHYVGPGLPSDLSNDVHMEEFCRRTVSTIWHYHGGCLVARVVDRNMRVFGRISTRTALNLLPGDTTNELLKILPKKLEMAYHGSSSKIPSSSVKHADSERKGKNNHNRIEDEKDKITTPSPGPTLINEVREGSENGGHKEIYEKLANLEKMLKELLSKSTVEVPEGSSSNVDVPEGNRWGRRTSMMLTGGAGIFAAAAGILLLLIGYKGYRACDSACDSIDQLLMEVRDAVQAWKAAGCPALITITFALFKKVDKGTDKK